MKNVINTEQKPIKLWLEEIEEGALNQAKNLANLPFIFKHIAIMPDAHQGYGMPIGGVMATQGVVVPNAVGVDIGCTDMDTEYLTRNGWKKISKYNNEAIAVYDKEKDTTFFEKPHRYITNECSTFHHVKNHRVDQMLTDDHRVILFSCRSGKPITLKLKKWLDKAKILKKGVNQQIKAIIPNIQEDGVDYTDDEIRLIVASSADGCIRNTTTGAVEFHLKKGRKIKRLKEILLANNIQWNEFNLIDNSFGCSFKFPKVTKSLSFAYMANIKQLEIMLDEIFLWDGHIADDGQKNYYSTIIENVDAVQYIISACGIRSNFYKQPKKNGKENWNDSYIVYSTNNNMVDFPKYERIKETNSVDGKSYCFTTTTGYWIMRRNGKIAITGNCGMIAVKTSLQHLDKETLKKIMGGSKEYKGGIRSVIPVGFGRHSKRQDESLMPGDIDFEDIGLPIVKREYYSALKQIGTLGGGNHFIEIQQGNDGFIWLMIHSGSRNIGFKVAKHYNDLAISLNEKWMSTVPKNWELAFLPLDSQEGQYYRAEMRYCVDFALASRELMMERVKMCVADVAGCVEFGEVINIAHNYAAIEHHFKTNVMVHRKGATRAYEDQLGVIPGSQGTSSYIVRGKGNPESFKSCSHGAGRRMGRKQAQRELNLENEKNRLDVLGVIHGIRNQKDLDEAPGAYKDISIVMENQTDLVSIEVELKPLAVIKG